jgi:hypothetical protein
MRFFYKSSLTRFCLFTDEIGDEIGFVEDKIHQRL